MTYPQNGSATSLQRLNTQPGSHCARSCLWRGCRWRGCRWRG